MTIILDKITLNDVVPGFIRKWIVLEKELPVFEGKEINNEDIFYIITP